LRESVLAWWWILVQLPQFHLFPSICQRFSELDIGSNFPEQAFEMSVVFGRFVSCRLLLLLFLCSPHPTLAKVGILNVAETVDLMRVFFAPAAPLLVKCASQKGMDIDDKDIEDLRGAAANQSPPFLALSSSKCGKAQFPLFNYPSGAASSQRLYSRQLRA
jgi:hypothetical protein